MLQLGVVASVDNGRDDDLSRAYRIIAEHHGSIRREDVAGRANRITVYLPLPHQDGTAPGAHLKVPT